MTDDGLYVALADDGLRLEPLTEAHRDPLRRACAADRAIWDIYPLSSIAYAFDPQFDRMLQGSILRRSYAIVLDETVIGMTAWIACGDFGWTIEIGNSYIVPEFRGTGQNRRIKKLMLDHAFACGLRRVAFKVDAINTRSRAAVVKLGCTEEGVMRSERKTWTGRVRNTVLYSILADEWAG